MVNASARRSPRHRDSTSPFWARLRRWRRTWLGAGVVVVFATVGIAPAAWSSWVGLTKADGSFKAGTISASLTGVPAMTVDASTKYVFGSFSVSNSGSASASYSVAFTSPANASVFRQLVYVWESTGGCTAMPGTGVQSGRWDAFSFTGTLTAGETQAMCMRVEFQAEAAESANYSFTGTLTLTNSRGSAWTAKSTSTSTISLTGATPAHLDISAVTSRVSEVTASGASGANAAATVTYKLFRSESAGSLGTEVATKSTALRLVDKLAETTVSNTAPADKDYWYTIIGYDSSGDISYTAGPRRLRWPLASDQDVLIREGTADRGLCWQASGTTAGSTILLKACDLNKSSQHFRLVRSASSTGQFLIRSMALGSPGLAAVRTFVSGNDTLTLGTAADDALHRFAPADHGTHTGAGSPTTFFDLVARVVCGAPA